jgi:hypothetical protein
LDVWNFDSRFVGYGEREDEEGSKLMPLSSA